MINTKKSKNQILNLMFVLLVFTTIVNVGVLDLYAFSKADNTSSKTTNKNPLLSKLPRNTKIKIISTTYTTSQTKHSNVEVQNQNQVNSGSNPQTANTNNQNSNANVQAASIPPIPSAPSTPSTSTIVYIPSSPLNITNNAELAGNATSGAGTVSSPYIIENLSITTSSATAISIQNTNVYFTLRNNNLSVSNSSFDGIYLNNVGNGTIANNTVSGSGNGIYVANSNFDTITNNTITNSSAGINLYSSTYNTVELNIIDNTSTAINLASSYYNTVDLNTINKSTTYGINVGSSTLNTVDNNTIHFAFDGIFIDYSSNNNSIANNIVNNSTYYGIIIEYTSIYNTLTNNTANYNAQYGFLVEQSNNNTLVSNTASFNGYSGFWIGLGNSTILQNNVATNNTNYGFYFYGSSWYNTVVNNQAYNNTNGFELGSATNFNNLTNNIATSNSKSGFYLTSTINNTLVGNTANNNTNSGIYIVSSQNTTLQSNTAEYNSNGYYFQSSSSNTATTNLAVSNTNGFYINQSSTLNTFNNNNATSNSNGYYVLNSNSNSFSNNIAFLNSNGFEITSSNSTTLFMNTANQNTANGLYVINSFFENISTNTANYNSYKDMLLTSVSNSTIYYNTLMSYFGASSTFGMILTNSNYNTIVNNTASNDVEGFRLSSSNYNSFFNNTADNNYDANSVYGHGLYIYQSNHNNLTSNYFNNNHYISIYLYSSNYTSVLNNYYVKGVYGFEFCYLYLANHNYMAYNIINDNYGYGFYVYGNSNSIINNTILNSNAPVEISLPSSNNSILTNTINYQGSRIYTASLYTPANGVTYNDNLTLNYQAGFYSSTSNLIIYIDNVANTTVMPSGTFLNTLTVGTHNITLVLTDLYGNVHTQMAIFTIADTTGPTITVTTPQYVDTTNFAFDYSVFDISPPINSTIYIDGTANTTALPSGSMLNLAQGTHNITIVSEDALGHLSSYQFIVTVDTTAPIISITVPTNNSLLLGNYTDLNYTISEQNSYTTVIYLDGVANSTLWQTGYNITNLADGLHNITIVATDIAGNVGKTTYLFSVDTQAPVISIITPVNQSYDQHNYALLNYSITEPNSYSTKIYLDGIANSTLWQPGYNITNLADGLHNITIVSTDIAGLVSNVTVLFTVDTIPPVMNVIGPVSGIYGNNQNDFLQPSKNMLFLAYVSDSVSYTISLTGNNTFEGYGFAYLNNSYLVPQYSGYYYLIMTLTDVAGYNITYQIFYYFQVTPPVITISSPTNNTITNQGTIYPSYSFSSLTWQSTTVYLNGVTNTTNLNSGFAWNLGVDGSYNLTIKVTDGVGDWAIAYVVFIKDTAPPVISIISPVNQSYLPRVYITLNYTISDNYNYTTVIYFDGIANATNWQPGTIINDAEGLHNVTFVVTDQIGNVGIVSDFFTLDVTAPVISITSPGNNTLDAPQIKLNYTVTELNLNYTVVYLDGIANSTSWQSGYTITGLSDGSHNITIVATDLAGNVGSITYLISVDATAPVISITSPTNQSFIANTYTILDYSITELHNYTTTIYLDGTANSTNWQSGYNITGLTDGLRNLTIVSTDQFGNVGKVTYLFTVDTKAPVVTISSPTNTTYGPTAINMDYSVTDANLKTITLYEDGIQVTTYASGTARTFSNGPHTFTVVGIDKAGNSASLTVYFTVDTAFPSLTFTSPANNSYINTNSPAIDYKASNYTSMYVYVDSLSSNNTNNYTSGFILTGLSEGLHNVTIKLVRTSNNEVLIESLLFTVDTIKPFLLIGNPGNNTGYNFKSIPFDYNVSDANLNYIIIYQNGVANTSSIPYGTKVGLTDGDYNITIVAVDLAGNTITREDLFYIDTTSPNVTINSPVPNSGFNTGSITVSYNATDAHLQSIIVYQDGVANTSAEPSGSVLSFAEGNHNITIYAVDTLGHSQSLTVNFYVDMTSPTVTITSPTSKGYNTWSIYINYTVSDLHLKTTSIYLDGILSYPTSGSISTFYDGNHNITIVAVDSVGNSKTETVLFYTDIGSGFSFSFYNPSNITYTTNSIPFTYSATDADLSNVTIYTNGVTNSTAEPSGSTLNLPDGYYNITILAIDSVGNSMSMSVYFTVSVSTTTTTTTTTTTPSSTGQGGSSSSSSNQRTTSPNNGQSPQQGSGNSSSSSTGGSSPGFGIDSILLVFVLVVPFIVIRRRKK